MKILFVCTGNTCRSPMAEALLKHKLPEAEVRSAGILASKNQQANQNAIEAVQVHNITLDHRSQAVTNELLDWADLVLTMTTQHKQSLILQYPNYQENYYTIKEYVSDDDREIWNKLKQAYANYQASRSLFIQENEHEYDKKRLDKIVAKRFKDDVQNIQQLEASLINYDISDPFGGDLKLYQETMNELNVYISQLIKKMDK